jgi:hypothetical protein
MSSENNGGYGLNCFMGQLLTGLIDVVMSIATLLKDQGEQIFRECLDGLLKLAAYRKYHCVGSFFLADIQFQLNFVLRWAKLFLSLLASCSKVAGILDLLHCQNCRNKVRCIEFMATCC